MLTFNVVGGLLVPGLPIPRLFVFFFLIFFFQSDRPISGNAIDAKRKQKTKQITKQKKPKQKQRKNMTQKKGPVRESNPGPLAP